MLGNRTALCVVLFATGCFSDDRALNEFESGGAGGSGATSDSEGGEASAGEASNLGGSVSGGRGGSQSAGTGGTAGSGGASGGSSGAGAGGSTAGSAGTSGNGSAGEGGAPSVPVGALCNSSDGEGCDARQFCLDAVNDACDPNTTETCAGFCAEAAPRPDLTTTCGACPEEFSCVSDPVDPARSFCTGTRACDAAAPCPEGFVCGADGNCAPARVDCSSPILCPAIAVACPAGYTYSVVDDCFGPCVPIESCACEKDLECGDNAASCDRVAGRCVIPKAPEPRCALPFEVGDCNAAIPVFAFVDGSCQPQTYGGCGGNDNRFSYLEECRSRCEGQPVPQDCPEGHVISRVCLECGLGGGCTQLQTVCAQTCDENTECSSPFLHCYDGVCQATPCF